MGQDHNTVCILPIERWKAYRIISFSIEGVPARLVYQRKVDREKIQTIPTQDPFYPGKTNQIPTLPTDDLDELLLSWFKIIDKDAHIDNELFIINTSEENFLLRYEGLPESKISLIAFPSFGDRSFEDLLNLEGEVFTQYSQVYKIYLYGHISEKPQLSITGYYNVGDKSEMDDLINRLRKEIIQ